MLGGQLLDRKTVTGMRCLKSENCILQAGGILGLEWQIWAQKLGCLFSLEITHLKAGIKTRLRLESAVLWETNVRITQKFPAEQFSQDGSPTGYTQE